MLRLDVACSDFYPLAVSVSDVIVTGSHFSSLLPVSDTLKLFFSVCVWGGCIEFLGAGVTDVCEPQGSAEIISSELLS